MIGKRIIIAGLLALCLLLLGPITGRADGGFLAGVEDLPLMPGLREIPEETLIYDKLDGRLVQAIASGESDLAALWRFYNETLPQLGWRRLATGHFVRDGEGLRITVEKNDAMLTVRFAIAPGTE